MTTGNGQTPATPEVDPQKPVAPAETPGESTPGESTPTTEVPRIAEDDPDMIALRAAEAELEAENKTEATPPVVPEPPAADKGALPPATSAQPPKTEPEPEPEPEQITIPKARFDEVRGKAREAQIAVIRAEAENKTLRDLIDRGIIQPHQAPGGTAVTPTPTAPPTISEQVATLRTQQQGLANDFEGGRMGAGEWEKKRQDIDDRILELRLNDRAPVAQPTEDLLLSERTNEIVVQYPILDHLQKEHLDPLAAIAIATMKFEGNVYDSNNPASVLDLRTRIAKMADQAYEMEGVHSPSRQPPATTQQPDPAAPAPATPGTASAAPEPAVTAAERKAKLELAARQPPSLTSAPGTTTGGLADLSDDQFLAMSTEEVAALPESVLDRILEGR